MANLTAGSRPRPYGQAGRKVTLPVKATAQLWESAMVAQINGACCTATTAGAGNVIGVAEFDMLGGATDGATRVSLMTDQIFTFAAGTLAPTDATPYGTPLYAETDNTVGTGNGTQTCIAGRFMGINDDGTVRVLVTNQASWFDSAAQSDGGTAPFKARAVVTALAANTGTTTGVLTKSSGGAIVTTADGVTLAVGDVVFVPAGIANLSAASDSGPYVVTVVGAGAVAGVLTRPSWWQTGATIVSGQKIDIGPEGALFPGQEFKAMCAKGSVVDTTDPALYPRTFRKKVTLANSQGNYTIGFGGGSELLFLYDTTLASVQCTMNTPAGTEGTNKLGAPSGSRIAGVPGTAVIVVQSYLDNGSNATTDTSTVDVLVTNW